MADPDPALEPCPPGQVRGLDGFCHPAPPRPPLPPVPPFQPPRPGTDPEPPPPPPIPPPAVLPPPLPLGGGGTFVDLGPPPPPPDYRIPREDFALLLIRKHFPERTDGESAVIRAFLLQHIYEFDNYTFGKRVGNGLAVDPTLLPGVQKQIAFSSRLRIDMLAYRGSRPVIIECKQRVTPAALGQILTYRHHFLEESPDALDPELVVVGREGSDDAIAALQAHGVTVYLYPDAQAVGHAPGGGV